MDEGGRFKLGRELGGEVMTGFLLVSGSRLNSDTLGHIALLEERLGLNGVRQILKTVDLFSRENRVGDLEGLEWDVDILLMRFQILKFEGFRRFVG